MTTPAGASIAAARTIEVLDDDFLRLPEIASIRFGKMKARDSLLDSVNIKPGDTVLDIGCGRGLLLMGAAKRVTSGHATGIDLWSNVDQLNNSRDATLA